MKKVCVEIAVLALLCLCAATQADVFNLGSGLTNLETVTVGDPGNRADTLVMYDGTSGYGAVGYIYNIGKYEITTAQYCDFLNHKAQSDPYGLWSFNMWGFPYIYSCNIKRRGTSGHFTYSVGGGNAWDLANWGNRPVNYITYWSACRFANWLNNGQGDGDTETGAYTLNGYNGADGSWIQRNAGAQWFLPSEDEWYKAAYYKNGVYSRYANGTNTAPVPGTDSNYNWAVGHTWDGSVNGSLEQNGTKDMMGNVWEWNEASIDGFFRCLRGGSYCESLPEAWWRDHGRIAMGGDGCYVGFRVAELTSIAVKIDIRPGEFPNSINLGSHGLIEVAILSSPDFDVASIDPATVKLAGVPVAQEGRSGKLHCERVDVDGDGRLELLLKFRSDSLSLAPDATAATLSGKTPEGRMIEGSDSVVIVGR